MLKKKNSYLKNYEWNSTQSASKHHLNIILSRSMMSKMSVIYNFIESTQLITQKLKMKNKISLMSSSKNHVD